jgi:hypothetical protein
LTIKDGKVTLGDEGGASVAERKQFVKIVKVIIDRHIPLVEKTCAQCEKKFVGVKVKRYCSTACAKKASYWRHPEAYRESRLKSYRKGKKETSSQPPAGKK